MEKVEIIIKTSNSAFNGCAEWEVARILKELATKIERGYSGGKIFDMNGNTVGTITIK